MTRVLRIEEFCRTGSGGTPARSRASYYSGGSIPWVKSGELHSGCVRETEEHITEEALNESAAKLVPRGAVLIALYGATVGQVSLLGIEAATNQAVCHIIPDNRICRPAYLCHFLKSKTRDFLHKRVGGGQPNISQGIIKSTEVPLPPLAEQERIAAILDQADALRDKRRQAIAKLDELLQAVFLDMFGDPITNSKGWKVVNLSAAGSLDRGISKNRPRNSPELLGGPYPLVQTGDVANSGGYIRRHSSTYSEVGLKQSKMWPKGTLCITIAANIANTGILTYDACFPDSVVGFIPNECSTTEYVQHLLGFLQKMLDDKATQVAQKNINLATLRSLPIPLPPVERQSEFSQIVSRLEESKNSCRSHLERLDTLFAALQQRAFKGEM